MFRLVVGAAIGYVLGSRAGRERYEQIKRWSKRAADHPAVQGAAGIAQAQAANALTLLGSKVTGLVKRSN